MKLRQVLTASACGLTLAALVGCDDFRSGSHQAATAANPTAQTADAVAPVAPPLAADSQAQPAAASVPAGAASASPLAQPIETADVSEPVEKGKPSDLLIRVETLLDRAHFSPGVIDGRPGDNFSRALSAFRQAHGLDQDGALDDATLKALGAAGPGAVTQDYTIVDADEAGPFIGNVGEDFVRLSKLDAVGYRDVVQELSARFHMSEGLLKALNPGADFTKPGTTILVVRPGEAPLPAKVAKVEVDKALNQVRAFDDAGKIEAVYPATVGSTERPAPDGQWAVKAVAPNPDYTYDPRKLTFGPKDKGVLIIKPGPNNPVGSTWIALTKETYGIHGTPDPTKVGKTASHGCVRLTNWDVAALGKAVTKGVPVIFVGETGKT